MSIYKSLIGIDEPGDKKVNNPGNTINYLIVVKNNGNVDLTGVSVIEPIVTLTKVTGNHENINRIMMDDRLLIYPKIIISIWNNFKFSHSCTQFNLLYQKMNK